MPTVPTYGADKIGTEPARGGYQQPAGAGKQAGELATGLRTVGDSLDKLQQQRDQDVAFSTDADVTRQFLEWNTKAQSAAKGANASGYADQVKTWWDEQRTQLTEKLTPSQQRVVGQSLARRSNAALESAIGHEKQQLTVSAAQSYDAGLNMLVQDAATTGTPEAARAALIDMADRRMRFAAANGWTPEQVKADELARASALQTTVVRKMALTDPVKAKAYYDEVKGSIDEKLQPQLEQSLRVSDEASAAAGQASSIWRSMGPRADGQPVELDKLEQAARDAFPNDPQKAKATIQELHGYANAFNAAERERSAAGVNAVVANYAKNPSIAAMKKSAEFQRLPPKEQNALEQHFISEQQAAVERGRSATRFAQGQASYAEDQREKAAMPKFFEKQDVGWLTNHSIEEVRALLPELGPRLTQHLIDKKNSLGKAEASYDATLDQNTFDAIANELKLGPFDKNKSDSDKEKLGVLKYRTEKMIRSEQERLGKKLSQDEREAIMRREMGTTVQLHTWWGGSSDPQPVITLGADQAAKVIIPPTERKKIVDKLQGAYKQNALPEFEPTEANVQRMFLQGKTPAAKLIPNGR